MSDKQNKPVSNNKRVAQFFQKMFYGAIIVIGVLLVANWMAALWTVRTPLDREEKAFAVDYCKSYGGFKAIDRGNSLRNTYAICNDRSVFQMDIVIERVGQKYCAVHEGFQTSIPSIRSELVPFLFEGPDTTVVCRNGRTFMLYQK